MTNHVAVDRHCDGGDELGKKDVPDLQKELPKAAQDDLKHKLRPFRKREADLDEVEQAPRDGLLAPTPPLQPPALPLHPQRSPIASRATADAGTAPCGSAILTSALPIRCGVMRHQRDAGRGLRAFGLGYSTETFHAILEAGMPPPWAAPQ